MAIDQVNVVDYISTDRKSGDVMLTISDHLSWFDVDAHLAALRRKINAYVGFVKDGQLAECRPDAAGRRVVVDLVLKDEPPTEALAYFGEIAKRLEELGIGFACRMLPVEQNG